MNRRAVSLILLFIFVLPSLALFVEHEQRATLNIVSFKAGRSTNSVVDVPNYRVGDTWVYDTDFDVSSLVQQSGVSASINTLDGDTTREVNAIGFVDVDGTQTLVYEILISGDFTSGASGATLDAISGTLNIAYDGADYVRVRDLATIVTVFELDVDFLPFNIGFLKQDIATLEFNTTYSPPKESHDFPLQNGNQWYSLIEAETDVSGSSDYFDPSGFDNTVTENYSWQITKNQAPSEGGKSPTYQGCQNSFKIMEWNGTGVNTGFNWYCPNVRGPAWNRVSNTAGFTIDWFLKTYSPADSTGVSATSDPGTRNKVINVQMTYPRVLPEIETSFSAQYLNGGNAVANTNLQVRYEIDKNIRNPTTNSVGNISISDLDTSEFTDDTPASDDYSSNGLIVWDPVARVIGVTSVVMDLSIVGVDLIAQASATIVERTRDGETTTLNSAVGFNSIPGDILTFSLPIENRGIATSPATTVQFLLDGNVLSTSSSTTVPAIGPYSTYRVELEYTVQVDQAIGTSTFSYIVDPTQSVTEDADRTNNQGNVDLFFGRLPTSNMTSTEGMFTWQNIMLDASASFDEDGGNIECMFEIEYKPSLITRIYAENCITEFNWSDDGQWNVHLIVTDNELDTSELNHTVNVLNRPPEFELTGPTSVEVESKITIEAVGVVDNDTISPEGQDVVISWPGLDCDEGMTQRVCTFTPLEEGPMRVKAVGVDDDGATTEVEYNITVLNIAPTIGQPQLILAGEPAVVNGDGVWVVNEDEVGFLNVLADDSISDEPTLLIEWHPSDKNANWTLTTTGAESMQLISWNVSGEHIISVRAVDDDGASSELRYGTVMVNNVPPTISGFFGDVPLFEDDPLYLSVDIDDTPSDLESLVVCWDLDSSVDLDNNGVMDDDCEVKGENLNASWGTKGVRQVTATVIDNDGASASISMNVSVLNLPPVPVIGTESLLTDLMEGDSIILSAAGTRETETDKLNLQYSWDVGYLDGNLDGKNAGDVDFTTESIELTNLPPGTWEIVLTVIDDDGEFQTTSMTIKVTEQPPDGIFESIESAIGPTMTYTLMTIVIVVVLLIGFMFITKPRASDDVYETKFDDAVFGIGGQAELPVFQQQPLPALPALPALPSLQASPHQPQPQPLPALDVVQTSIQPNPMATAPVSSGPPLPATGLPQGWTMDQWNYYGQQWLDANSTPAPPVQPQAFDTAPQPAPSSIHDLLDDLDF
ncbi:MAG: CARDB domain-containing protein [Candidatus Poseidoniales archaeon]